jgi:hypothetical protein
MLSLMAMIALGACGDDDDPVSSQEVAEVRVVNASPGTPSVTVAISNRTLVTDVAFQTASGCSSTLRVPAGNQIINFRASATSSTNVKAIPFSFVAGQRYTIVLFGPSNNLQAAVVPDEATPGTAGANANRLRFINATSTATAADIFGTTATGTIGGTPQVANLASGAGTAGTTMYQDIANTNVRFRLFNTGTTATARGDFTLGTFTNSRNATIVFTDAATTGGPTAFQVNSCP